MTLYLHVGKVSVRGLHRRVVTYVCSDGYDGSSIVVGYSANSFSPKFSSTCNMKLNNLKELKVKDEH